MSEAELTTLVLICSRKGVNIEDEASRWRLMLFDDISLNTNQSTGVNKLFIDID